MKKKFPHFRQLDAMDCGPTCLRMISKFYGKTYSLQSLRDKSYITREGVSMMGIADAAESIGFRSMGVRITFDQLAEQATLPAICHWNQAHFVVVHKIEKKKNKTIVHVADPASGMLKFTKEEFIKAWASTKVDGDLKGLCLLLEPTPDFYKAKDESGSKKKSIGFLLRYLKPYKKFLFQLFLGMLFGSMLQLIFPFLTQSVVDIGINTQNLSFITLVLVAQLVLFISRISVEFIRSWILLHISTRINISLISDFLIKLMKLPIGFFDIKMIGDLLQRIQDHTRIENFLTSSTLNILFSMVNLLIFGVVLAIYNTTIFLVFLLGSSLYIIWINLFLKKRRELDGKRFAQLSSNQNSLVQLITGMQEIKLNNCEKQKRWEWEQIQAELFQVRTKGLALNQYQVSGSVFFNETKNIVITFLAAQAVVNGSMTLGMMLAVQYILGQLNSPIDNLVQFIHSWQDAKISLERLGEIHEMEDEEVDKDEKLIELPEDKSIHIDKVCFQYEGPHSEMVLNDVDLHVAKGKTTAIVGASGSGKTTLIKLMLGFYPATKGKINLGGVSIQNYSSAMWRQNCGVVMQDGFIFSDTIAKNIAVGDEVIDKKRLLYAVQVACIHDFIDSLPLRYNTKIGANGHGLSQGQKQRILIARAVYKNPEFLFFDEATNALDANNERAIMENLDEFNQGRTVVVVAHRLSTVRNADKIIVLDKGQIVEHGSHNDLTKLKGRYYELVKNQLELGN
ncbi:peptidase domain-containing ABC transporter [Ancylomarina salipaludis]|uniref:Peptidase domain-containing ABC transporter n=1 Tax=Ancylomarina salipaludis TaxID=2501299 RepID=A0A4Q1JM86_9BACT|nr:peptidase domain-containing ABC transporter [Ancylomarina salipaludis]RXQ95086.1 peptidase domain-containing ABC transporter [Ancylomarina salipaludis]